MKKILIILAVIILVFVFDNHLSRADEVVLNNGEVVKGKIIYVLAGFIEIRTDSGNKKIFREVQKGLARDIIEAKKKKVSGEVYFLDEEAAEIITDSGNIKIKRSRIKNIILSQ